MKGLDVAECADEIDKRRRIDNNRCCCCCCFRCLRHLMEEDEENWMIRSLSVNAAIKKLLSSAFIRKNEDRRNRWTAAAVSIFSGLFCSAGHLRSAPGAIAPLQSRGRRQTRKIDFKKRKTLACCAGVARRLAAKFPLPIKKPN